MKKAFRLVALSALVMGLAVACNNNQPTEAVVDSVLEEQIDSIVEDISIDSALVVEEEPVATPAPEKKKTTTTAKKTNTAVKATGDAMSQDNASATVKINTNEPVKAVEATTTATKEAADLNKKATKANKKLKK